MCHVGLLGAKTTSDVFSLYPPDLGGAGILKCQMIVWQENFLQIFCLPSKPHGWPVGRNSAT